MRNKFKIAGAFILAGMVIGTNIAFMFADPDNWVQYAIGIPASLGAMSAGYVWMNENDLSESSNVPPKESPEQAR